ncbi:MAG: (2Fe-2S)-binding protein [Fidelibacterota bacterium]
MKVTFLLNRIQVTADCTPGTTLLEFLRNSELYSVKYGCDDGRCGACSVIIEDCVCNSCLVLVHTLSGKNVLTLEGLNEDELVRNIQDRFLSEGAIQCGYCSPGMILSLAVLLRKNKKPAETEIQEAISGNYCRCTGYVKPIKAMTK